MPEILDQKFDWENWKICSKTDWEKLFDQKLDSVEMLNNDRMSEIFDQNFDSVKILIIKSKER